MKDGKPVSRRWFIESLYDSINHPLWRLLPYLDGCSPTLIGRNITECEVPEDLLPHLKALAELVATWEKDVKAPFRIVAYDRKEK